MVPVIDTYGHPGKCGLVSSEGFESPSYLSDGKPSKEIPSDVIDLLSIVRQEKYNLVLQATSIVHEKWPFCDGYFVVPSVSVVAEGEKTLFSIKPETKDIAGTVLAAVKSMFHFNHCIQTALSGTGMRLLVRGYYCLPLFQMIQLRFTRAT